VLLITLLCLPVIASRGGYLPREQAYAGLPDEAGSVGANVSAIYHDSADADVLFLGSSLLRAGVDLPEVERALSTHLGRPAHVVMLGMNWQGLDLQYFLLRDYLNSHHAKLIVWNLPVPGSRDLVPHIEAFHWVRFGEYADALSGLPPRFRLALYSDMVLGAPREILSHLRPNLLEEPEDLVAIRSVKVGYYGAGFVPESFDTAPIPDAEQSYEDPPYASVHDAGRPLSPYGEHFARKILALAKERDTEIVLLHIPIASEQGMNYMPERELWNDTLHTDAPMIGLASSVLFKDVDKEHFYHFYRDQHFNINGKTFFTRSILPAILKAYDGKEKHE